MSNFQTKTKNSISAAFLTLLFCSFFAFPFLSCAETEEKILDFDSAIQVLADGTMTVTETIRVVASGNEIKHGIYRDFPTRYKDRFGNRTVVDFNILKVSRDGVSENYFLKSLSNGWRVYIGRQDYLLAPGEYTYVITYATNRQLGFFKDFDELYWNVTGNGWIFPIEKVTCSIELPKGANRRIISDGGYTGRQGSRGAQVVSSREFDRIVFTTTVPLKSYEGLTAYVDWPKGYVREPTPAQRISYFIRDNRGLLLALIGLLIIILYYLIVWDRFGRDPAKGTIIPLFNPPQNISPAAMRYIMKMGYDNKILTCAIVNMAVKGYFKIVDTKSIYWIKRMSEDESVLSQEEAAVDHALMGPNKEIELKQENHVAIQNTIKNLKAVLRNDYEKIYFFTNIQYFVPGLIFSVLTIVASGAMQSVEKFAMAIFVCTWLTFWTFGVMVLLQNVLRLWKQFFTGKSGQPFIFVGACIATLFSIPFLVGEIAGFVFLVYATSFAVASMGILLAAINYLFYNLLRAPTLKGRSLMDQIEGFKMYLSVAEKERLAILNPSEKTPELFEKYLPYALALDVEQAWAEQFSSVFEQLAKTGQEYHPRWYSGTTFATFSASGFASSMGSSLSGAIASSSTAPGSSSGGGGGGGSSGGGGGGGGGGGW